MKAPATRGSRFGKASLALLRALAVLGIFGLGVPLPLIVALVGAGHINGWIPPIGLGGMIACGAVLALESRLGQPVTAGLLLAMAATIDSVLVVTKGRVDICSRIVRRIACPLSGAVCIRT